MISVEHLSKSYNGHAVLNDVSFTVNPGETTVFIGYSGSGKSTLLRCLNYLVTPDSGVIKYDGKEINAQTGDLDKFRQRVGMVYQDFNLFSHLNVLENVILAPIKVLGLSREEAVSRAEKILKGLQLSTHMDYTPDQLSGGQKQRVAIARALAMKPDTLLFDEPTSSLDPSMVSGFVNVINYLSEKCEHCIVVTHDLNLAQQIGDHIIFLQDGKICEDGSVEQVFKHPSDARTRRFIFNSRMFECSVDGKYADFYELNGNLKAFLSRFEHTRRQLDSFPVFFDELIIPVFSCLEDEQCKANIRMICSENTHEHTLFISFYGLENDPLGEPYTDFLSNTILQAYSKLIMSKKIETGYEVVIRF